MSAEPYFRPEWIRWTASPSDEPPMSGVAVDGETAIAWGERDGVLYILDVYEVEASCAEPLLPLNTFRPMFLPKARPMSQKPGIVFAAAVALCTSLMGAALLRIIINTIRNHQ